jgi:hypothetical protein
MSGRGGDGKGHTPTTPSTPPEGGSGAPSYAVTRWVDSRPRQSVGEPLSSTAAPEALARKGGPSQERGYDKADAGRFQVPLRGRLSRA